MNGPKWTKDQLDQRTRSGRDQLVQRKKLLVPGRRILAYFNPCGAMVQGKLPVLGHPTIWMVVGQGPIALAVGAGCLGIFTLLYPFSPLSPSLWETTQYRLIYFRKGPLNRSRKLTKRQIICQSANYLSFYKSYHL